MDVKDRVKWVYSAKNNEELSERYDQWAKDYDRDLENDFGYVGPRYAADYFEKYVPLDAEILDAGAGTGMIGELLYAKGYRDLAAMDLSKGMLEQARKKNVYKEFHQMVMGGALGFQTDRFDAVICTGALTEGHAPANSLDELFRITRPGGHVLYTLRTDLYEGAGFKEKNNSLSQLGKWTLVEKGDEIQALPKGEPDVYLEAWIFEVSGSL
jgi:SAM-dependent methyltransferase